MALAARSLFALFLAVVAGFAVPAAATSASMVGVNYGRVADNIPPPEKVPSIVASIGVGRVRIYDADPHVLHAFANTGIEVIVTLPDRCLPSMAADPNEALVWVRANIQPYLPATKIAAVMVGNEILNNANDTDYALARSLVPTMENIHSALASLSLDGTVAVTTSHSLSVLAVPSYPPSAAVFRSELLPFIRPLIDFHARTDSPFFINAYPYFAYVKDSSQVALEYARLDPGAPSITDPGSGLCYTNLLHAQIDAVYHAIAAARGESAKRVMVWVSETGWPSAGDPNEIGATPENAGKYNSNLIRLVATNKGTPLMPGTPLRAYIFALFNENQKPGPTSERNYGLFKADGTPAYHLDIAVPLQNDPPSGEGSDEGSNDGSTLVPVGGSSGYFGFSSATGLRSHWQRKMKFLLAFAVLAVVVSN
ncbi:glucan endo-1,3-beta-glucosidase 10-like [Zingiber officinale]|uniref:glucan endo-1,3-beta-glucosidase 10-like n=1 Tax=Zingiber officinale TaxID=94328 RepID=UPI001C4BC12C|nr:glucan endo-1,3-beta-glucosidase 10-like [Zingiber officinale]